MKIAFAKPSLPTEGAIAVAVLEGKLLSASARKLDDEADGAITRALANSRFEGKKGQTLMMNPADAAQRGLAEGAEVVAYNHLGEVGFCLKVTDRVPAGTVVTEGVWWREFIPGQRGVNCLTSQRLTDGGRGSTLYDVAVEVRGA